MKNNCFVYILYSEPPCPFFELLIFIYTYQPAKQHYCSFSVYFLYLSTSTDYFPSELKQVLAFLVKPSPILPHTL